MTSTTHRLSPYSLRDKLNELADLLVRLNTLNLADTSPVDGLRAPLGSRVPPGMREFLDQDEAERLVRFIDYYASSWCGVLVDAYIVDTLPWTVTDRLRLLSGHTDWICSHEDSMWPIYMDDDVNELRGLARRIVGRENRHIRTGHGCVDPACVGQLVSTLGADNADGTARRDGALTCDRCAVSVPFDTWSRWPRARVIWITPEHAARLHGGCTVAAVRTKASRGRWRRVGTGRTVRYHVDDVRP
ncbi:MAG: hypothetical protein LBB54_04375 [Cellulomonadaceae bacterium]|jgi:hypothetical protein|nr:hypothetical protein [Cellulomonadaceae bacterium]